MNWAMMFDGVVSILLLVAIYYCWKLNKYLTVIRDSKSELAQTIYEFTEATNKAQKSIIDLKNASHIIADKLQVKIEKAEFMADDLAYLIERANKTSHKLSDKLKEETEPAGAKPSPKYTPPPPTIDPSRRPARSGIESLAKKPDADDKKEEAADADGKKARSKAEIELLKALKSIR